MTEHSSVEKNIELLRLFFKDLIEEQAIYEKSNSRVLEFSLAFDHSHFGGVSVLLQVDLELDGSLIRFTGLNIEYDDTSKESAFMEAAQTLRLGAHSYLELARGVVVDPSEESLKSEFSGVSRTYIPMHSIVRIDEVEKMGQSKVSKAEGGAGTVTPFPVITNNHETGNS